MKRWARRDCPLRRYDVDRLRQCADLARANGDEPMATVLSDIADRIEAVLER